jgi:hypothetical protein
VQNLRAKILIRRKREREERKKEKKKEIADNKNPEQTAG